MRIILVDDEQSARAYLKRLLCETSQNIEITGEAGSVADAIGLIRLTQFDLLLLDVQMQDGTGFDLLDRLEAWDFNVIFTTAHDDFAVRAFRYHAIDYLLKPIVPEELEDAINRVRTGSGSPLRQQQIMHLLQTATTRTFDQVTLQTGSGLVFVHTRDIVRLETYGNYSFVYMASGERHLASRNLKEFEEMLPEPMFFRVHQSHIVNTSCIKQILKEDGGHIILSDQAKIPVARRRKEDFMSLVRKFFPSVS